MIPTQTVQKAIGTPDGDKVIQTQYTVTLYDRNGRLTTTTKTSQLNYLI